MRQSASPTGGRFGRREVGAWLGLAAIGLACIGFAGCRWFRHHHGYGGAPGSGQGPGAGLQDDTDPGFPTKRVRFKNASKRKKVKAGMKVHYSPSKWGSSGFTLHSNSWNEFPTESPWDERTVATLDYKRSYRFTLEIENGPTLNNVVAERGTDLTNADDVGVCEAQLIDWPENDPNPQGFKLRFRFTYVRDPDDPVPANYRYTEWWESGLFLDPPP